MGQALRLSLLWLLVLCAFISLVNAHDPSTDDASALVTIPAEDTESDGMVVRCRMCGATIAHKRDYTQFHDTSKSVSSRPEHIFGEYGEVHTFANPSRVEMEIVAFKKAIAVEGESFTNRATFFEDYNWRDLQCSSCNRHIGWKFHHNDHQKCIHTAIMDAVSAKSQEVLQASAATELNRKVDTVRKELEGKCIVASAGWWTYQVCYGKEVRQFHEEADGSRPSDWSMGVFSTNGEQTRADEKRKAASSVDVVQYFTGGQQCDENGEKRNSKVVYSCCKSNPKTTTIESVEEPSLCSYVITVCVPSLCDSAIKEKLPYDYEEISATCKRDFEHAQPDTPLPASFAALRWSTVISEDSSELDWARNLQFHA